VRHRWNGSKGKDYENNYSGVQVNLKDIVKLVETHCFVLKKL